MRCLIHLNVFPAQTTNNLFFDLEGSIPLLNPLLLLGSKQLLWTGASVVGDQTKGTVSGLNCEILFDPMDLSKASISGTIDASTLTTGNKARDKHLSASDFFHVEKYPVMKFESNEVVKEGKEYLMNGSLTIKDTTEPCSIRFTYADGVFLGKTAIDAKKYGVSPGKKEGTVQVTFSLPVL